MIHLAMNPNYHPLEGDRIRIAGITQKLARSRCRDMPLNEWQATLRAKVTELLGYEEPKDIPDLNYRRLGTFPDELGTIEKFVITVDEKTQIPGYICLPQKGEPPYDWFLCVQGHSSGMHNSIGRAYNDESRKIAVEAERDFALGCMGRGIAAVCIEQRGFGERRDMEAIENDQLTACRGPAGRALLMGTTLLAQRLYDIKRAAQVVLERDDCRKGTLGIMGNSGGGTSALFAAALFPELFKKAMPSCYVNTFADSILAMDHCICNYVPGLYRWADMADIAGLIAPRTLVVVAGREDPIFPIEGAMKARKIIGEIYKEAGAPDSWAYAEGPGGHQFYGKQAWEAMEKLG